MNSRAIVIFCGLLTAASAIAIDITLPVVPEMVADLGAPYATVQLTVTVYMLCAGLGQLFWGPASDRFGRRPVLIAGLAAFLAGSIAATVSPGVEVLIAARAIQGLGGAAAIVLGRAILRDMFNGEELARNLAFATAVFAAGPIVAPFVGGAIALAIGWRGVLGFLAVVGAAALVTAICMPETAVGRSPSALSATSYATRFREFLAVRQSRYFLAVATLGMTSMLFIITSAPRIYDVNFGVSGMAFAAFFGLHGCGIIIGQIANRRLIPVIGIVPAMRIAGAVLVLGASLILLVGLTGIATPYLLSAILILYATSYLVVFSNSTAMVLDPHGRMAGYAASILGVGTQVGASVAVSCIVLFTGGSIALFAAALLAICLAVLAMTLAWRPQTTRAGA